MTEKRCFTPSETLTECVAKALCRHAHPTRSIEEAVSPNVDLWMRFMPEAAIAVAAIEKALRSETERSERDAVIEEVAKHIEASPLTYFGPDPGGVRDLRYLIVAAIRDMKGRP